MMKAIYEQWISQLSTDQKHAQSEAQRKEYDEWIHWIKLQQSKNRNSDIVVYHWTLEGVEHGPKSLEYIATALRCQEGIYPDLEEEEGPKNLDHIDV